MRKIRCLALLVAVMLILTTFSWVCAAEFADVPADKYSWAVGAISSMSEKGIIKGYEDGTFRPEKAVTKLEALVLTARVLGFGDSANKSLLNVAIETYGDKISEYKLNFGESEIAYLIIKNIISIDELADYVGNGSASSAMKRYEIAVLITKALDAEESIKNTVITSLEYSDSAQIPAFAKKYVEYVTNQGIMNGMGDNKFSPETSVTRAQAALLFNKLLNLTGYSFKNGFVESVDPISKVIKIKTNKENLEYTLSEAVALRFEGSRISLDNVAIQYDAIVTLKAGVPYVIDFVTPVLDFELYARVSEISEAETSIISVYEISQNGIDASDNEKISLPLVTGCIVAKNNEIIDFNNIVSDDYVKLNIKQGMVTSITVFEKSETFVGVVSKVESSPAFKYTVTSETGVVKEYTLTSETKITKDGSAAATTDILVGDTAAFTKEYGKISNVVIASPVYEKSGIITEIIISANPSLTLKVGEEENTYKIANDCIFNLTGKKDAELYDLRFASSVTVTIRGEKIALIKSEISDAITQVTGNVVAANNEYSVIQVTYVDTANNTSVIVPVFLKPSAAIIDISTGKALKLSEVKEGANVTVFGLKNNGVFEATIVNVLAN